MTTMADTFREWLESGGRGWVRWGGARGVAADSTETGGQSWGPTCEDFLLLHRRGGGSDGHQTTGVSLSHSKESERSSVCVAPAGKHKGDGTQ